LRNERKNKSAKAKFILIIRIVSISCITVTDKRHIANIAINAN